LPEGFTTNGGGSGVVAVSASTDNPLGAFEDDDEDEVVEVGEGKADDAKVENDASQAEASPPVIA
jgi:hypothetical protein